ncbi:MAG: tRNA (N6-isopentenyl adenosine(37)-C2)-methylthiotransferase MiaB [Lachnospiraceae bacterium]|nr:tRNA (N6-isopentenyl adenosine(37)-C2)-methylthiotransferase MiaB [Lachnospiraceae bacterium]
MRQQIDISAEESAKQLQFAHLLKERLDTKRQALGRDLTYHIETFGCQMNAKDSEKLAGILETIGYKETEDENADIVLYNTCTVRENANNRVYGRVGFLGKLKKKKPDMKIILCGCMMQEQHVVEKIKSSYRFVDIIFGTHNIYKLAELLYEQENSDGMCIDIQKDADRIVENLPSARKYSFKGGVNIMYGCNNFCSYCIVPYVRGRERSRRPDDILQEIREMTENGVSEIMLLGQNVNSYGHGLEESINFAGLLEKVCRIDKVKRVRFMTPHPKDLTDDIIEVIAREPKVCNHVHLPLQSGSSRLLKLMNRHYTKEDYLALTERIKAGIPGVSLTTDIIVGFPGETEEDFEETLDVVKKVRFSSAFTFIYSKRTGTPAAKMPDQVPEEVVKKRFDRLLKTISDISAEITEEAVGNIENVLVEEKSSQGEGYVTGRLANNLLVHFKGDESLLGSYVDVKLLEAKGFYYIGEIFS